MKKKWLAILLSFFVPGLGQFYLGKIYSGILFLIVSIGSFIATNYGYTGFSVLSVAIWIIAMVHAGKIANDINKKNDNKY